MGSRRGTGGTPATVALTRAGIAFTEHAYTHDPAAASYGLEAAEVLGHMTAETARHAGHADILREQLDGATGR